ncbi:hypothetical protein ACOSP7_029737 [Xanthoceras sorbifolium]
MADAADPFHFNGPNREEELETASEQQETEDDDEEDSIDYEEEEDDIEDLIPVVESPLTVSDEEEEDQEEEDDEEDLLLAMESPLRVSDSGSVNIGDGERRRVVDERGKSCSLSDQWNRSDIDGLFCSICMDAWTNNGDHHISCLPCGHIYGLSCIKKWLQRCRSSGKCPQCNQKCSLKDVRKLFASRIVAVDEESQKKIQSLEAKCSFFEKKGADWRKKEAEWQKREAELHLEFQKLEKRTVFLEFLFGDKHSMHSGFAVKAGDCQGQSVSGPVVGSKFCTEGSSCISKIEERFDDLHHIFVAHKVELEKMRSEIQKILEKQEVLNTQASEILTLVHHRFSSGPSNQS